MALPQIEHRSAVVVITHLPPFNRKPPRFGFSPDELAAVADNLDIAKTAVQLPVIPA